MMFFFFEKKKSRRRRMSKQSNEKVVEPFDWNGIGIFNRILSPFFTLSKRNGLCRKRIRINMNWFRNGALSKKKFRIPRRLFEIFNEIIVGINFVLPLWRNTETRHSHIQLRHFD